MKGQLLPEVQWQVADDEDDDGEGDDVVDESGKEILAGGTDKKKGSRRPTSHDRKQGNR